MKILYSQGNFLSMGHQIMVYPATEGVESNTNIEKAIMKAVPEAKESVRNLFAENEHYEMPKPVMGDVIWTETSGRKWYAHCIILNEDQTINYEALALCLKSIAKKAIALNGATVGFPVFGCNKSSTVQWNRIYPMIEEALEETQAFVYDPSDDFLRQLVTSLPGEKTEIYADPVIRFRTFE